MMDILEKIVEKRRKKIERVGHGMGIKLPEKRRFPLVPFGRDPFIICEFKRSSPSKGTISRDADAVKQAKKYSSKGVRSVSVLTEDEYFSGSLHDLIEIKSSLPHLSLLRKDFLLDEEDIDVSYRAGADAVLLIASVHDEETLELLFKKTESLGMEALIELHSAHDLKKVKRIKPEFTGINSRNLKNFHIDLNAPFELGKEIDWKTCKVFESGIRSARDVSRALNAGFSGVLVGETVMRNTELIDDMYRTFTPQLGAFWSSLFSKKRKGRPLVKICGITNNKDAYFAAQMGADVLGFIFTDSPRKIRPRLLQEIQSLDILKVGVVVKDGQKKLIIDREIEDLLKNGLLDAVQFHGKESPESCSSFPYQHYKAVRVKSNTEISLIGQYLCPRVLIDTYIPGKPGGTGKRIPDYLISEIKASYPLWLAGGIGPQNVRDIIGRFKPELIDASSLLESTPGKKDHKKVKNLFREIKIGTNI